MLKNKKITVIVPHRISGFFEIVDQTKEGIKITNPERIGSTGAGFNLSAVGKTNIEIERGNDIPEIECKIYINNTKLNQKAETTYFIFDYIRKLINRPVKIKISHNFDLPVGCGYGASGSGALGTIFGLDFLLNLNLSQNEKGKIAHIAEVINKTGLGTVCGQLSGGLCVLKKPGFPCVAEQINTPKNLRVICGTFGMIPTKSILTSETLSKKIKIAGRKALMKVLAEKSIKSFLKASIEFVEETDILNALNLTKTLQLMENLNKLNILGASMNQLGRSIFACCKETEVNKVLEVFDCFKPEIETYNLYINKNKPIFLKK
ncbi:MAG: pantoate kinase [Candidatus Hermodarchaeota archaeon]